MTLGRLSILLTALLVLVPFGAVMVLGQVSMTAWLLVAPVPSLVVYGLLREYEDWTLGHVWERVQGEAPVAADLDRALRPPPSHAAAPDDGAFILPGVPALPPRAFAPGPPPAEPAPAPPTSTPPR